MKDWVILHMEKAKIQKPKFTFEGKGSARKYIQDLEQFFAFGTISDDHELVYITHSIRGQVRDRWELIGQYYCKIWSEFKVEIFENMEAKRKIRKPEFDQRIGKFGKSVRKRLRIRSV